MSATKFATEMQQVHAVVERIWFEIEQSFLPIRRKYDHGSAMVEGD
jgi:hypothetical protein